MKILTQRGSRPQQGTAISPMLASLTFWSETSKWINENNITSNFAFIMHDQIFALIPIPLLNSSY